MTRVRKDIRLPIGMHESWCPARFRAVHADGLRAERKRTIEICAEIAAGFRPHQWARDVLDAIETVLDEEMKAGEKEDMDTITRIMRGLSVHDSYEYDQTQKATLGNVMGEEKLLYAVLLDALHTIDGRLTAGTYSAAKESKKSIREEALRWIWKNDYEWPCSFVNICEHFHLDVEAVRKQIAAREKVRKAA